MQNFIKIFSIKSKAILALLLLFVCLGFTQPALAQDSKGTEFWIAFPGNLSSTATQLFITSEQASTVTINVPGISFTQVVNVVAGGLQTVNLPASVQVQTQFVPDNKGIHITATTEVTVYGMNAQTATTDAFLAFPIDALGKEYYVLGYNKDFANSIPTQATIVATENNTKVTITATETGGGFTKGVPMDVVLQQGQVYQLRSLNNNADYTGTKVTADKPISVFGGAQCTNISGTLRACDHLVEQLPPLSSWGKSFVTVPLATRLKGDVFRFMAQKNGTVVSVNGLVVATLAAGGFFETILGSTSYNRVTSTEPILVGQYSRSSEADGVTSDPFFTLIPPDEQFLNNYTISAGTANIPNNWVNITSPTSNLGNVKVDNLVVNSALWKPIPGTSFSGAIVPVSVGVHRITSVLPIGVMVYGFGSFDSYGYLGGQSFSAVATVTSVKINLTQGTTAIVGSQYCLTAKATDQNNNPLSGIRVDFNITGANPMVGFAFTEANGIATFCYTGTKAGVDHIVGSVGGISDATDVTWTEDGGGGGGNCTAPTFLNNLQIVLDASCGKNDGNVSIIPTTGIAPFMYSKDGGATYIAGPDAGYTFNNLAAGTYKLRLKDSKGCESAIVEKTVRSIYGGPTFLNNGQIVLDATCGRSDGSISIIPTKGTPPFLYSINGGATYSSGPNGGFTFNNLSVGTYMLKLKDAGGCESETISRMVKYSSECLNTLENPGVVGSNVPDMPLINKKESISVYPNPSKGQFKVQLSNFSPSKSEVFIFDGKGTLIEKNSVNLPNNSVANFDLSRRTPGFYYIKIVTKTGTKTAKVLIQ